MVNGVFAPSISSASSDIYSLEFILKNTISLLYDSMHILKFKILVMMLFQIVL